MNVKLIFLLLAVLAASSMAGIGITLAEGSLVGMLLFFLALCIIMGVGFTLKSRWKEKL